MIRKSPSYLLLVLLFLLTLCSFTASAAGGELYQATVSVASYSSADFKKGSTAALRQVFIAVSGNPNITSMASVQKALEKPDKFVQAYNYTAATVGGEFQLSLSVRFSSKAVNRFLRSIDQRVLAIDGTPALDESSQGNTNVPSEEYPPPSDESSQNTETLTFPAEQAPVFEESLQNTNVLSAPPIEAPILVWLVERDAQGQLGILHDASHLAVASMQTASQKQGVALLWPVMDLEDISALSPERIWQLDQVAVEQASRRYEVNDILVGRLQQNIHGKWQADWVWLKDGEVQKTMETEGDDVFAATTAILTALSNVTAR
ncbi:MAG: hypothetical protein K0Q74_772 [Gammaproteobacteria bacterium]|jgi:hypothetical protein|nr:hypothetical protein [Gammaproteobacteria bacterium]